MNTIPEVANEELLLSNDIKASVTTNSSNITMSTSSNNNIHTNQNQASNTNNNNNNNNNSSSSNASQAGASANGVSATEDLKIIGHLKNIEKINEKRRIFLTNTISEYSTEEKIETKTSSNSTTNGQHNNGLNGGAAENNNNVLHTIEELRTHHISEQHFDNTNDNNNTETPLNASSSITTKYSTATSTLKSPTTPPPKPPMLSRAKSLTSPPNSPAFTQKSPINNPYTAATVFTMPATAAATPLTTSTPAPAPTPTPSAAAASSNANETAVNSNAAITTATITTTVVPETVKVTTLPLKDKQFDTETPLLRHAIPSVHERATSASPAQALKQISVNHYQRLIEELRCPGCAAPMKAPILLCKSGHSVCEQCTRILLMCPLCKEPFTSIRSLTVEALCRKAHFRCANATSGCNVRLQIDLLAWHERQCIYKPMKCFMGRVWGDCEWTGREVDWKEHLETEHANKVYCMETVDLIWNMGIKQKPLTGYYVFQAFGEMFNFYEVFDKERVLFTMACTSTIKEKKLNYAFEVTMIHQDNEALAITQKFPVHSEYDSDILAEGSCVSISLADLAKFIDEERLLHYRVRILEIKTTPRKFKTTRHSMPNMHPIDFQQTQIEGVNLKNVPAEVIVTRKQQQQTDIGLKKSSTHSLVDAADAASSDEDEIDKIRRLYNEKCTSSPNDSCSESDPEFEAFIAKRWGTPQLHFKRKYLKTDSNNGSTSPDDISRTDDVLGKLDRKFQTDDKTSISSTSYKKRMSNTLRRSFRTLKTEVIEMNPFGKKSPEKKKPIVE